MQVVKLNAQQDRVDRCDLFRSCYGVDAVEREGQATLGGDRGCTERFEAFAARNEGDVGSCLLQPAAVKQTDRAGPHHCDAYVGVLFLLCSCALGANLRPTLPVWDFGLVSHGKHDFAFQWRNQRQLHNMR
jgi:hypothetical protein